VYDPKDVEDRYETRLRPLIAAKLKAAMLRRVGASVSDEMTRLRPFACKRATPASRSTGRPEWQSRVPIHSEMLRLDGVQSTGGGGFAAD
jgi:non-homologous end joining protein Ku